MVDGCDIRRHHGPDWVALTAVISTVILAVSLFVAVLLAYRSSGEAQKLRVQVAAGDAVNECRARFTNEDARLAGLKVDAFLDRELARSAGNQDLVARYDKYLITLAPARVVASMERTLSTDVCQQDPDAKPTDTHLPPVPQ